MAKADFEFYKFPNLPSEFVRPAHASDPYKGMIAPERAGRLAVATLGEVIKIAAEKPLELNIQTRRATKSETTNYFFNQIPLTNKIVRQHVEISFPLPEDEDADAGGSSTMRAITNTLSSMRKLSQNFEDEEDNKATIVSFYEGIGYSETDLTDDDGIPKHARVWPSLSLVTPLRAYRWLPGPERTSALGERLVPTYSPRPSDIVFAQVVNITGLNPQA